MLSKALKILRVHTGLKSGEFGEKIGLDQSVMSMVELGKRDPNMDIIAKYAKYFKVESSWIMLFAETLKTKKGLDQAIQDAVMKTIVDWTEK